MAFVVRSLTSVLFVLAACSSSGSSTADGTDGTTGTGETTATSDTAGTAGTRDTGDSSSADGDPTSSTTPGTDSATTMGTTGGESSGSTSQGAVDCAGVPGGAAVEDMCGTCDDDPSNDCLLDCGGRWGGDATLDACGRCDADSSNDCVGLVQLDAGWDCELNESCQDVYDVELFADTTLYVDVETVTGGSVPRLALFAPGDPLDGTNLLTGGLLDRECSGQNEDDHVVITVPEDGIYRLAVGRDWNDSFMFSGTYSLRVGSRSNLYWLGQTIDDAASLAPGGVCGFASLSGAWDCDDGVSCQDVYDVVVTDNMALTVAVTGVTGFSVARIAVFAPGVPLDGVNLLTNSAFDWSCSGQNGSESRTTVLPGPGTYRVAVGRDWGSSVNGDGTYELTLTGDELFAAPTQTVEDAPTQSMGLVCL